MLSSLLTSCAPLQPAAAPTQIPVEPPSTPAATKPSVSPTPTLAPSPQPTSQDDLVYTPGYHLDLRLPAEGAGPYPTVLLLHGATVNKSTLHVLADHLAQQEYAAVAADWLDLWPTDRPTLSNPFCALAWIHLNAEEYGFDRDRVAVLGHSAGGYAAALLGTVDDPAVFLQDCPHQLSDLGRPQAVITYGGVLGVKEGTIIKRMTAKLPPEDRDLVYETLMDTPYQEWPGIGGFSESGLELLRVLPPTHVDGSEPPFVLLYGEFDVGVDPAISQAFGALLRERGVDARPAMIAGAGHLDIIGTGYPGFAGACRAIDSFLAEVLD